MEWPGDFPEDHSFVELLVPGVSSELDFEQLLKDTEEKLNLNANSIEQQLKELQAKMGDSRTGERPPSPSECLQWFNLRAHNSFRPVTTGHQELMDFFRALQQYLRSEEEGKEEVTLQLLLDVSAQCGVCFPCTPTLHPQLTASSVHLVHTVRDDTSIEIQDAWDDVRLQLRRHLLDRLSSRSPEHPGLGHISILSIPERVHCLQQLFFLYPECEALTHYQGLRVQSVLGLLSALSSSPGGETGFDKLALGFRSVVPALTQAVTDELHVLSRVAEPHAILGFLNVAYFSIVARELASLMERECEMALRDNTTLSSKIKKYSARSRATVAPMELPMKNRSFSLTSHQLRALTQLACTLLGFERIVKELVTNMTFIDCTGETPCVKGILKKSRGDSHMTTDGKKSPAEAFLHTPEAQVLEFDWRSAFIGLVPHMAHCVKVVLDDACAKSLQQEEALHSSGHTSVELSGTTGHTASNERLREDSFYTYSERETPNMIAKFCGAIMTELDALLPLAAACGDSSLQEVRSSFVEACGRAAFAMLGRLQERALEVPSSAPLKNLPTLLATGIYLHQRLEHYHARLKDSNAAAAKVPLTLLPIQKCQDMVEALRDQLTSYCIQVCSTCILQDAESHHWADPRPFYEGERCSFSLQMWFYFLCGLRSDLWAILPADLAKEMLGQVLSETLQLLVQRYAMARPSYKRHLQIRCDITAVLLYVEQLMWSVCESPEALVRSDPYSAISHNVGQIRLAVPNPQPVRATADSPRHCHSAAAFAAQVGYYDRSREESTTRQPDGRVVHWLNVIDPDLFTEQAIRDGLMGQTASTCQLRLLTSDPGRNPRLLLRTLLYGDCHLPRMLLENSYTTLTVPAVIKCVRAIVTKSTHSLLVHLVSMVMDWQATEEPSGALFKRNVPESVLAKIPKEWSYTPLEARGKETATKTVISLTIQALSFVFTNLPLAVASVPLSIRYLFQVAEKQLSQHSRQLRLVGLLLWALLSCLIQGLEDPNTLEQISGLTLYRGAKEPLSLLAECLQAAMGIQQKGVPKPSIHKVLQALEEKRPKWTNMQLQKARKLCSDSVFEQGSESGVAAAELTEQKIGLMLLEVCHKAGGSDYLRQIYHIIQGNESAVVDWSWDWPRLLPAYQGMSQVTFKTLLANSCHAASYQGAMGLLHLVSTPTPNPF
ncbi:hypothetical protein D9C73_012286 [Collichthys lucidus]|uniref:KIAA0825 n=1 Tax=Collichthys lucidus TaxID=240159 RepID=A0A4U5UUI8_COLLU|nr:hypothetical protein D9C73_012286 [Collichthys lucidus]